MCYAALWQSSTKRYDWLASCVSEEARVSWEFREKIREKMEKNRGRCQCPEVDWHVVHSVLSPHAQCSRDRLINQDISVTEDEQVSEWVWSVEVKVKTICLTCLTGQKKTAPSNISLMFRNLYSSAALMDIAVLFHLSDTDVSSTTKESQQLTACWLVSVSVWQPSQHNHAGRARVDSETPALTQRIFYASLLGWRFWLFCCRVSAPSRS